MVYDDLNSSKLRKSDDLKKWFSYIPDDAPQFGPGLKGLFWTESETLAYTKILQNNPKVLMMLKCPRSNLKIQKKKAYYILLTKLLEANHERLKMVSMMQLRGKFKTVNQRASKNHDDLAYQKSCSQTGGGIGLRRPPTPSGDDMEQAEVEAVGYSDIAKGFLGVPTHTLFFEKDGKTAVARPNDISDTEIDISPPPSPKSNSTFLEGSPKATTVVQSVVNESIGVAGPSNGSSVAGAYSSTELSSGSNDVAGPSTKLSKPLRKRKSKQQQVRGQEGKERPVKKNKLSNEEENFLRNKRSERVATEQIKYQQMLRLKAQIEIVKICREEGMEVPQSRIDDINNDGGNQENDVIIC